MTETMALGELSALLNRLLEGERAGARLVAAWMAEASPESLLYQRLRDVQGDEARNCSILIHHLLDAGAVPSVHTGEFFEKGIALRDWEERLAFLNRGQAWVARKIAAALPRLGPSSARDALQEMHDSHLANIARCESLIAPA
jgi:hypothetical protein